MGYKLQNITIQNLRHIPPEPSLTIDFSNLDLAIFAGPNGFGKSTVFDAIEILLTGELSRLDRNILNRGKVEDVVLANQVDANIVIKGDFLNERTQTILQVKRILDTQNNEKWLGIRTNDGAELVQRTDEELFSLLGFSKDTFHPAVYISQSQSLQFMAQKYKDRKQQLSSVIEDPSGSELESKLKVFIDQLNKRKRDWEAIKRDAITKLKSKSVNLQRQVEQLKGQNIIPPYKKLFEKEYFFDKKDVYSEEQDYTDVIAPLEEIKMLILNHQDLVDTLYNVELEKTLELSEREYKAYFFSSVIVDLKKRQAEIDEIRLVQAYSEHLNTGKWGINPALLTTIGFDAGLLKEIQENDRERGALEAQLSKDQRLMVYLTERRTSLIGILEEAVEKGKWNENKCPLCGFITDDLPSLLERTGNSIQEKKTGLETRVLELEKNNEILFKHEVIPHINKYLDANQRLIQAADMLGDYTEVKTDFLATALEKYEIKDFKNPLEEVSFTTFEKFYQRLRKDLLAHKREVKPLDEKTIQALNRIRLMYYKGGAPTHNIEDIDEKINYIAAHYSNSLSKEHEQASKELSALETSFKQSSELLELELNEISAIRANFQKALKQQQTKISNAIQVPLFIYSGRIIQNYPAGLGITTKVDDNRIVFTALDNADDVYNMLSSGQLNGLMLALLFALRSVYGKQIGLDMLLIDDPLQTIDDISAVSFADLLASELRQVQVLFSTHEDDKARLLHYKCQQRGHRVELVNMKNRYLGSGT